MQHFSVVVVAFTWHLRKTSVAQGTSNGDGDGCVVEGEAKLS